MKSGVSWINDYLDPPASAEEQNAVLTAVGFPIDDEGVAENGEAWLEVELTSNRGDCLAHLSLAREIAAVTGRRVKWPPAAAKPGPVEGAGAIEVVNHIPDRCPLYTGRVIDGVKVGPSPEWLRRRLEAIGQIPRNNLVDATNFVLFELGQPTHVFDLAKLRGQRIEIRLAKEGEPFLPLGEGATPIKLSADDLVIADAERPVALAGVKGGAETAVTEATTSILVEAATFDPVSVRSASRRHTIRSDSSHRFERGVHAAEVAAAADRLVALILEIAGGTLRGGVSADGLAIPQPKQLVLRAKRVRDVLGIEIPDAKIEEILAKLDLRPRRETSDGGTIFRVTVPPRRLDLEREIDLIEEVCRIHGLDAIPLRDRLEIRPAGTQPRVEATRLARDLLASMGFLETVTHSLIAPRLASAFLGEGESLLQVDDERAGGTPFLRPSLLPSLLEVLARNEGAGARDLAFFEVAATFRVLADRSHRERREIGLAIDGGEDPQAAYRRLRGAIERLVERLTGGSLVVESAEDATVAGCFPAARLSIDLPSGSRVSLGTAGLLDEKVLGLAGVDRPVAVAELALEPLLAAFPPLSKIVEPPQFPGTERDVSVVVAETVPWSSIESAVRDAKPPHLEGLSFVTTWRGKSLGGDRKSVTLRLRFRHPDRTLRSEEIEPAIAAVVASLKDRVGGEIRGGA
ncbi:MAG: phenylalanine--tRNA ligase subunit beta [Phycisphaerales bacterium]